MHQVKNAEAERAVIQIRLRAVGIPLKVNINSGRKPNGIPERS
jgi:hypothetical protein